MQVTVGDLYDYINEIAPFSTQASFDNAGLQVGGREQPCSKILVALDVTSEVVCEAEQIGADVILSHHPLLFRAVKSVSDEDIVYKAIRRGIAVLSAHTNWDVATGGVSDVLCTLCVTKGERVSLQDAEGCAYGRVGDLDAEMPLKAYAEQVKKTLNSLCVRVVDGQKPVKKVAVAGGSGGDMIKVVKAFGADTLVTGELKHHEFAEAKELGLNVVEAGHFETEHPSMETLADLVRARFPSVSVTVSQKHKNSWFSI